MAHATQGRIVDPGYPPCPAVGLVLSKQVQRGAIDAAIRVGSAKGAISAAGLGFRAELFQTKDVAGGWSFAAVLAPGLTLSHLLSSLLTYMVQRLHHLLAAGFLLLRGVGELDYDVHAGAVAFSGDDLLGRFGVGGVCGKGDGRANRRVTVDTVWSWSWCGRVHLGSSFRAASWTGVRDALGTGLRWLVGDLTVYDTGTPLGPLLLEELPWKVFRAAVHSAERAQDDVGHEDGSHQAENGYGTLRSQSVELCRIIAL